MGVEIRIELDEALRQDLEAVTGEGSGYPDLNAYVHDLIANDITRRRTGGAAVLTHLRRAFATPASEYVEVTLDDVLARGRARRGP